MTSKVSAGVAACNLDDSAIALGGYSPVSYFESGRPERGDTKYTAEHNGAKYYFTSEEQRQRFLADPDKYEPALGGWCAFGMTLGKRFRADPTRFKIVDGKLFVFLHDIEVDALGLWNEGNEAELTAKAEHEWERSAA